jgi:tRNA nucleotidyltransferase/poly(A) polymerase
LQLPAAIRQITAQLADRGHECWLFGETLHALARAEAPTGWCLMTSADAAAIAECFATAVPVRPGGASYCLPAPGGPIEIAPLRNGTKIEDDLQHAGYSVLSMAYCVARSEWIDPHGGREDVAARRLRLADRAEEQLAAEPLRVLRGARLVAQGGYAPAPGLVDQLARVPASALLATAVPALRRELLALLHSERPGAGIALLRDTGHEASLVPGAPEDAAALIDALPNDPRVRLAAWLRGSGGRRTLRQLRIGQPLSAEVIGLLDQHPIDVTLDAAQPRQIERFVKRVPRQTREALFVLRECELDVRAPADSEAAHARLRALREAIDTHERERDVHSRSPKLAVDGRAVMKLLSLSPGPSVGRVLRYLGERIAEDPSLNTADQLSTLARAWSGSHESERHEH